MILGFSTQINKKPTYFVERIWNSFDTQFAIDNFQNYFDIDEGYIFNDDAISLPAKPHTIREDKTDRWKAGTKINFFINVRKKDMFCFAPVLPVVSVQKVEILWYRKDCNAFIEHKYLYKDRNVRVYIDGSAIKEDKIRLLAKNDGFDTVDDFFEYFKENFIGKLIHWTDKRY